MNKLSSRQLLAAALVSLIPNALAIWLAFFPPTFVQDSGVRAPKPVSQNEARPDQRASTMAQVEQR